NGIGALLYSWSPSTDLSSSSIAYPVHTGNSPGIVTYTVTVTDGNGIIGTADIDITVEVLPVADAGIGGDECDLDFALDATPSVGTGTWSQIMGPGTSSFAPNANDPDAVVTVDAYGTYVFRWTEVNGTSL